MENQPEEKGDNKLDGMAKYSAIAFQMLATIGVITFIGYKIDGYRKKDDYLFTAILGIVGVALSLFQIIRQLTKP